MDTLTLESTPPARLEGIRTTGGTVPDELDGRSYAVWWYGQLQKSLKDPKQPKVAVLIREVLDDEGRLGDFCSVPLNISYLGLLRIGSVWRFERGTAIRTHQARYEIKTFHVDFSHGGWDYYEIGDEYPPPMPYLIPRNEYPIFGGHRSLMAHAAMVTFKLRQSGTLIIPCLELLTRTYGVSAELRRTLVTYPWTEAEKRFYSTPDEPLPNEPGTWAVCMGRDMRDGDAVLLAHIRHDPYAARQARYISAQVHSTSGGKLFLRVPPWNTGLGTLKVAGIAIKGTGTERFLGLNILGMSLPKCPPIWRDRANTNKTGTNDEQTVVGTGYDDLPRSRAPRPGEVIGLQSDEPPSRDAGTTEVREMAMEFTNPPLIQDVHRSRTKSTRKSGGGDRLGGGKASTGDRHGSRGVDKASVYTPTAMALGSEGGTLSGMWNAFKRLADEEPGIGNVEYFTPGGYRADSPPMMIRFPFTKGMTERAQKWVLGVGRVRGALVMRIQTTVGNIHVVEIERASKESENGLQESEAFRGLAFQVMPAERRLDDMIYSLLHVVPEHVGRLENLLRSWTPPGVVQTFKHSQSQNNVYPFENVAKNALGKLGVNLSR